MKIIIWTSIFSLICGITLSQEKHKLNGSVYDAITNQPIEFASAILTSKDSTIIEGTISDSNGVFKFLDLPDKHAYLTIKHLSYYDTVVSLISLKQDHYFNINLSPKENNLEEIIIIGEQTQTKNSLAKLDFIVNDKIKNESALVFDVIDRIPIAYVDFNNNIWINGSNKVLVLVNGIEIPDNGLLNQITPQMIEKIEVNTSPPSKYSNKNYSAIINIIADRTGTVGSSLGIKLAPTNNFYDANTSISYAKNDHNLYGLYKLYYRNYEETINTTYIFDSSIVYTSLLTFPRKEMDNEFFYGYYFTRSHKTIVGLDGYTSFYQENFETKINNETNDDYKTLDEDFNTNDFQAYYKTQDSLYSIDVFLSWNQKLLEDKNLLLTGDDLEIRKERLTKMGGWLDIEKKIKNISTNTGLEYFYISAIENYKNSLQYRIDQDYQENRFSSYFDFSKELSKRGIRIGLNFYYLNRYFNKDNINVSDVFLAPNFSYIEKMNSKNSIKLSLTSSLNNPSLWQMISVPITINPFTVYFGNPFLKPEKRQNIMLEYSYSNKSTYMGINCFYRKMNNAIYQNYDQTDNEIVKLTNKNTDKVYEYGTSYSISYSIFSWWIIKSFAEVYYQNLPDNDTLYKTSDIAWNISISSYWPITRKLFAGFKYDYKSPLLINQGWSEPFNSNLFLIRYKFNKMINASFMVTQPFGRYESKFYINNNFQEIEQISTINVRTAIISINFNLTKNNYKEPDNLYYNEDKKY